MNEKELRKMIEKGESETVELEESFDKDVLETTSAFANARGGTIFIGVNDNREIKGISVGKETLKNWVNEISQATEPTVIPEIEKNELNGNIIVSIKIAESPLKPVSYKGVCYLRAGNGNKKLTPKEIADMHLRTTGSSWDSYPAREAKIEDIDIEKVEKYITLANGAGRRRILEDPLQVLEKLELIKEGKPTWAAILLFGKEPQRFVLQAKIHCGRFKNETTIIDDELIDGDILGQIDKTMNFVKKNLKVEFVITGKPRRDEIWEYPLEAVREAVINAVCHRDYTEPSDIQVRISDDALIVWSSGKLPLGITLEDLYKPHKSVLRNKLIAQTFFDVGLIERWGTGVKRIIETCRKYGLPDPLFDEYLGFRVIFRRSFAEDELSKLGLNERQSKAVAYAEKRGSITNKEYQELNNTTKRTATRDLTGLLQKGLFRKIGVGKRELKYVLILRQDVPKMSQTMSQGDDVER